MGQEPHPSQRTRKDGPPGPESLKAMRVSEEERQMILGGNAKRLLGI
jgi:hypothetical protein